MNRVVNQRSVKKIERFLGTGLQPLKIGIPSDYASNPYFCPYLLDENCEGSKDRDYNGRCESETFAYKDCKLYKDFEEKANVLSEENKTSKRKISDPLSDTVIMGAEDVVSSNRVRRKVPKRIDDSLNDRISDGEDSRKFYYLIRCMEMSPDDSRIR